jgi:uncharacterized protein (TIGR00255 family)
MINSMTGFGGKSREIPPFGKISVELRSSNHKFLETVLHLPEGFLLLEDRIKKEIEGRVKRGRITCMININASSAPAVYINEKLLKNYLAVLKKIKQQFRVQGEASLDTLIHLPGVLSLAESEVPKERIWPALKSLLAEVVDNFVRTRQKEGLALQKYLKGRVKIIKSDVSLLQDRFKQVLQRETAKLKTPEEKSSFLKDADISEETSRISFHLKNFEHKLSQAGPVGKELDFIAQEMQREANTIGAKSCDSLLSARVVQIKSQIEKIREQVQNVE